MRRLRRPRVKAKSKKKYALPGSKQLSKQGTGIKVRKSKKSDRRAVRVRSPKLRQAIALYREEKVDASMDMLNDLLDDASLTKGDRAIAEFFMGKALFSKQLYYASVPYFQKVVRDYSGQAFYPYSFRRLVWIARRDDRYDVLTSVLKGKKSTLVPRNYRDDVYFMLAQDYFEAGQYKRALSAIRSIQPASEHYHQALLIKAYVHVRQRKYDEAIEVLNKAAQGPDENIKGLAFLAIARIHYGRGEDKLAAINFARVDQRSRYWLMSQLEAAWSHFRANEPSQALGNVHPFDTDPFAKVFAPEASIIKSTVFFRLCKYEESEKSILAFFERYVPVYQQLRTFNAKYAGNAQAYSQEVMKAVFGENAQLPELLTSEIFRRPGLVHGFLS